jgi:predicted exporter
MGLDYVVFLSESKEKTHVAFALLLSSITTILSFGLLSLSQVAVIKSFGFTLAIGIFIILLISPAILKSTSKKIT